MWTVKRSLSRLEEIKDFLETFCQEINYELVELIEELRGDDVIIVLENEELLNYKMEEYILINREKENIYRKRFENLKKKRFRN